MTRSGRSAMMRSVSGSTSAPTVGSDRTSGGSTSYVLTATTWGPAPIANRISVTFGTSEMIRFGGACANATTKGTTNAKQSTNKLFLGPQVVVLVLPIVFFVAFVVAFFIMIVSPTARERTVRRSAP